MRIRTVAFATVFVFCAAAIIITAVRLATRVPQNRDEISWYFHTRFFDEAFLAHRYFSDVWYGYESFDHPPVAKYVYGMALYLKNPSYMKERDALERTYGRWEFYRTIPSDRVVHTLPFGPHIAYLRSVNIGVLVLLFGVLFVLAYTVTSSVWASLAFCLALAVNRVFIESVSTVTSDIYMMLFAAVAAICYIWSFSAPRDRWLIGAAVASALSIGSKLNGVVIVYTVVLMELLRAWTGTGSGRHIRRVGLYVAVFIGTWIVINPALYRSPVSGSFRYLSFRDYQSAVIARIVPEVALRTPVDTLVASACTLVIRGCDTPHSAAGAVSANDTINTVLFAGMLVYMAYALRKRRAPVMFLSVLFWSTILFYSLFLSNYAPKYFVLSQVTLYILEAAALTEFIRMTVWRMRKRGKAQRNKFPPYDGGNY